MPTYVIYYDQGNSPGPFNVYLSGSSGQTLYAAGVTINELQVGYLVNVPIGVPSSSIVVTNEAFGCSNEEILPFPSPTTTTTPTPTVTPSITPTRTITPSITPTITPSRTITPTITPSRTITPTATPTITPSFSTGASPTPTPTPTITRTPSITPTPSPSVLPLYQYTNCGWGNTPGVACGDAYNSLWSICPPGGFGVGCSLYTDALGTIPLSNYSNFPYYVFINGALWDYSVYFNYIWAYSSQQC